MSDIVLADPKIAFNQAIHESNEFGEPVRTAEGEIRKKRNWQIYALDRQGRTHNPKIHGKTHELDSDGFLQVRRRGERKPPSSTNQSEAFVDKYREAGYAYYVVNDEGGRIGMFEGDDWEQVTTPEGRAELPVGQARMPNTKAVLMKKPIEWYLADQDAKVEANKARSENTSPKEEGQYEAEAKPGRPYVDNPQLNTPLR